MADRPTPKRVQTQPRVVRKPAKEIVIGEESTEPSPEAPKEAGARPVEADSRAAIQAPPPARKKPLPFKIQSARETPRWLKMLIYGNYGTGKTTLAATAQDVVDMQDVLFIDAEAGGMSLAERPDIDSITITSYAQFARVFEYLRLHVRARDNNDLETLARLESVYKEVEVKPKNVKKYRTVVIDSITEVHKYCMYQVLGMEVGDYALDLEPAAAEWKDWGKGAEMIRLLVRSFRNLPMHVIVVASENTTEDETKRQLKSPGLSGKLSKEIQGLLDVVGYLYAAPTETGLRRRLFLEPGKTFDAKSRAQWIKVPHIDEPTMSLIMSGGE